MTGDSEGAERRPGLAGEVTLRDVVAEDLPFFFRQQLDPAASYMAAFTAKDPADRDAFTAHWTNILADSSNVNRTILVGGQVAGNIACFEWEGMREVGYWIDRQYWGRGIATEALSQFLRIVTTRPLYASAAADNAASIRVLQKCGFVIKSYGKGFANARGKEIDEVLLELR